MSNKIVYRVTFQDNINLDRETVPSTDHVEQVLQDNAAEDLDFGGFVVVEDITPEYE